MAYRKVVKADFVQYINESGKRISVKNIPVIKADGFIFKDYEGKGELLPYEDWRLSDEERAVDLTGRLSVEEIMGLMLHTSSQVVPAMPGTMMVTSTYDGKVFSESDAKPWTLTDQQKIMLRKDGVRHLLAANHQDVETAVKWTNQLQELAEGLPHGIPVNISSDPRHSVGDENIEFKTSNAAVSKWPEGFGIAAGFSPESCKEYAMIVAREYRALGITTALGPQIDLATDPRWMRGQDTFGVDAKLTAAMGKAYCDGLQTTMDTEDGWGKDSVIAMAKHWPGGGSGEGGRDAHYPFGKYAVYPGDNFEEHLKPFIDGVMKLDGKTIKCATVMPYYTISWEKDKKNEKQVGNAYNEYIVKELLRGKYNYEGVVCTDWNITQDKTPHIGMYVMGGKCHGVEHLKVEERFLKLIMNGVNQFGGVDTKEYVTKAYYLGCERYGQKVMEERLRTSAYKILLNMLKVGLFEDPYLDAEESQKTVGQSAYRRAGYAAQLASVVMLKNRNHTLPMKKKLKVYIPDRHIAEHYNFVRMLDQPKNIKPINETLLKEYFTVADSAEQADLAIVFVESPIGDGGFEPKDMEKGENGYRPISLQYRPYTAVQARKVSIAGGDPREVTANRSYRGKSALTANESDLDNVIRMRKIMGEKPVIVCMRMKNAAVLSEIEPYADAILAEFGVERRALLDIITGRTEPTGRLPIVLPKDMDTVEKHNEDVAFDLDVYQDSEGNSYEFGFGLNFSGMLKNEVTKN